MRRSTRHSPGRWRSGPAWCSRCIDGPSGSTLTAERSALHAARYEILRQVNLAQDDRTARQARQLTVALCSDCGAVLAGWDGAALAVDVQPAVPAPRRRARDLDTGRAAARRAPSEHRPRRPLPAGRLRSILGVWVAGVEPGQRLVDLVIDGHPPAGLSRRR